jgi:hypothetical protein
MFDINHPDICLMHNTASNSSVLDQCYSTFFVRISPDVISLQLCTPKAVRV